MMIIGSMGLWMPGVAVPAGPGLSAWTAMSSGHPTGTVLFGVTGYVAPDSNKHVFVGGTFGRYARSVNGAAFSPATVSGSSNTIRGVARGDAFVGAVTEGGELITFPDGGGSQISVVTSEVIARLRRGGSWLNVVGQSGFAGRWDPTDALLWTERNASGTALGNLSDVVYIDGPTTLTKRVFAVGVSGDMIRSTATMNTWTPAGSSVSADLNGIAYGGGIAVAVGANGTVIRSTNHGTSWSSVAGSGRPTFHAVAYGDGLFVAVGDSASAWVSADGLTWAAHAGLSSAENQDICYFEGKFYVVGGDGNVNVAAVV